MQIQKMEPGVFLLFSLSSSSCSPCHRGHGAATLPHARPAPWRTRRTLHDVWALTCCPALLSPPAFSGSRPTPAPVLPPRRRRHRRRIAAAWSLPGASRRRPLLRRLLLFLRTGGIEPESPGSPPSSSTSSTSPPAARNKFRRFRSPRRRRALTQSRVSSPLTCSSSRSSFHSRRCPSSPAVTTSARAGRSCD